MKCTPQRRRRSALVALTLALCALSLAGWQCDRGGVIGSSDDATGGLTPAATSAQRLCAWRHLGDYYIRGGQTSAAGSVRCGRNRQIFATCQIQLFAHPSGHAIYTQRTHGDQGCGAWVRSSCPDCWQARGSAFTMWLRLDNPARRWGRGFVDGDDAIHCTKDLLPSGQHRLICLARQGSGPVVPAVTTEQQRARIRVACIARVGTAACRRVENQVAKEVFTSRAGRARIDRYLERLERR